MSASSHRSRIKRFGAVGILNTLIDYVLFIGLTKVFSLPLSQVWIAKLISGAVAMGNSFYLNRKWVFRSQGHNLTHEAAKFLTTTLVGVFVIQLGLTQLFSNTWTGPGNLVYEILQAVGLTSLMPNLLTHAFVIKTVAFALATGASLCWNYLAYHHVVFRSNQTPAKT